MVRWTGGGETGCGRKKLPLLSVSSCGWRRRRSWWLHETGGNARLLPESYSRPGPAQTRTSGAVPCRGSLALWGLLHSVVPLVTGPTRWRTGFSASPTSYSAASFRSKMNNFLGYPSCLTSSLLKKYLTGPTTLHCLNCHGTIRESIKLQVQRV